MRKKYLSDGSYSPMSAMLSLLAYGKYAAMREGNAGNASWSPDKKTFYLNGRPIMVERFRKMPKLTKIRRILSSCRTRAQR
jgi:hypothetical protein